LEDFFSCRTACLRSKRMQMTSLLMPSDVCVPCDRSLSLSPPAPFSLSLFRSRPLFFLPYLSRATYACPATGLSLLPPPPLSLSFSFVLALCFSCSISRALSLILSLSLSLFLILSLSFSLSFFLSLSLSRALCLSFSRSH